MVKPILIVPSGTGTTGEDMPWEKHPDVYCRVTSVTFRVLEPYAVKVASTVLRRERRGNPPDLSGSVLLASRCHLSGLSWHSYFVSSGLKYRPATAPWQLLLKSISRIPGEIYPPANLGQFLLKLLVLTEQASIFVAWQIRSAFITLKKLYHDQN